MENVTKVIDKTVVGKTMPTNPNTLWLDTTEGEKNAILKYKGNPVVGGSNGSGSGGTTSGIPTIDKNTQPNIVWREPTEEDLAKFADVSNNIWQVADLPDGKLPMYLIEGNFGGPYQGESQFIEFNSLEEVSAVAEDEVYGYSCVYNYPNLGVKKIYYIDLDWSLLAVEGVA